MALYIFISFPIRKFYVNKKGMRSSVKFGSTRLPAWICFGSRRKHAFFFFFVFRLLSCGSASESEVDVHDDPTLLMILQNKSTNNLVGDPFLNDR